MYNGIQVEMDYMSKFKQSVKGINVENNESYALPPHLGVRQAVKMKRKANKHDDCIP